MFIVQTREGPQWVAEEHSEFGHLAEAIAAMRELVSEGLAEADDVRIVEVVRVIPYIAPAWSERFGERADEAYDRLAA